MLGKGCGASLVQGRRSRKAVNRSSSSKSTPRGSTWQTRQSAILAHPPAPPSSFPTLRQQRARLHDSPRSSGPFAALVPLVLVEQLCLCTGPVRADFSPVISIKISPDRPRFRKPVPASSFQLYKLGECLPPGWWWPLCMYARPRQDVTHERCMFASPPADASRS